MKKFQVHKLIIEPSRERSPHKADKEYEVEDWRKLLKHDSDYLLKNQTPRHIYLRYYYTFDELEEYSDEYLSLNFSNIDNLARRELSKTNIAIFESLKRVMHPQCIECPHAQINMSGGRRNKEWDMTIGADIISDRMDLYARCNCLADFHRDCPAFNSERTVDPIATDYGVIWRRDDPDNRPVEVNFDKKKYMSEKAKELNVEVYDGPTW